MSESVAEALQREISRVRDDVMPAYLAIGDAGKIALHFMRHDLDAAVKALAEQDALACIRQLEALRGFHT